MSTEKELVMSAAVADLINPIKKTFGDYQSMLSTSAPQIRAVIAREAVQLFNTVPELDYVEWTQYTPSFNDGDPCVFSVNGFTFVFTTDMMVDDEWREAGDEIQIYSTNHEICVSKDGKQIDNGRSQRILSFVHDMNSIPEELMEHAFGDNTKVTITKAGISTEEYYQ